MSEPLFLTYEQVMADDSLTVTWAETALRQVPRTYKLLKITVQPRSAAARAIEAVGALAEEITRQCPALAAMTPAGTDTCLFHVT